MKAVSINSRLRGIRARLNYGTTIGVIKSVKVPMVKYDKEAKEGYTDQEIRQQILNPLPTALIIILREYLETRGGKEEDYLFPQEANKRFSDKKHLFMPLDIHGQRIVY